MSGKNPVKNIIFDFGGVIINLDGVLTTSALSKLGFPNIFGRWNELEPGNYFDLLETGKISGDEFHSHLCKDFGVEVDRSSFLTAWNAMLKDIPLPRLDFLKHLKPKYRTFLLSNTNEIHVAAFHEYVNANFGLPDLSPLFEKVYYSNHMGLRKPDREIYRTVLRESKLEASETLFVDDTRANIEAASLEGLQVLHLTSDLEMIDAVNRYLS